MSDRSPSPLDTAGEFVARHIGPDDAERAEMLATVGAASLDALMDAVVPEKIRVRAPLPFGVGVSEADVVARLRALAEQNRVATSLIGMGYTGTITPPVVLRNILENPAWYTAYTPYQPEISQGRLEAMLRFQTMVAELTNMDLAGASLLDDATAAADSIHARSQAQIPPLVPRLPLAWAGAGFPVPDLGDISPPFARRGQSTSPVAHHSPGTLSACPATA